MLATGRASTPYIARQGTALGRRGRVYLTSDAQGIWVGGATHVAIRGTINL
jgi:predicted PhzF superfamily epimerase YddE/YHI9